MTRNARHDLSSKLIDRAERWYRIGDRYNDAVSFGGRGECERIDAACTRAYRMARRYQTAGFNAA